jgi:AraC-like DNA-binding protein
VSVIAFEVGFQTLTHFNRVFKNTAGQSLTWTDGSIAG